MVCKVMLKGLQGDVELCSRHEHNHDMMFFFVGSPFQFHPIPIEFRGEWQTKDKRSAIYTPEVWNNHWKMMVQRLLSFWDGNFSGAMLNFWGVPRIRVDG